MRFFDAPEQGWLKYNIFLLVLLTTAAPALAVPPPFSSCMLETNEYVSSDIPVSILDNTTVESVLNVSNATDVMVDVDLNLNITHTFSSDLEITLVSPSGTEVTITTDNGGGNDNVFAGTTFDDQAGESVTDHTYSNLVVATPLIPEGALGIVAGETANGEWKLRINDDAGADQGTLNGWSLSISSCSDYPPAVASGVSISTSPAEPILDLTPLESTLVSSGLQGEICQVSLYLDVSHTWSADLEIELMSPSGLSTTITTDNGGGNDNVYAGTQFVDAPGIPTVTDNIYANNVAAEFLVPEGAMSAFDGTEPNGEWKLTINDDTNADQGTLNTWALTITTCDVDSDGDNVVDSNDNCVSDSNSSQVDSDSDGAGDACDLCPVDASKLEPGVCGCGVSDADSDSSGLSDCLVGPEANLVSSEIAARIAALNYTKKRKAKKAVKSEINAIRGLLDQLRSYIDANGTSILFIEGATQDSFNGLAKKLNKKLKRLSRKLRQSKRNFRRARNKARKIADQMEQGLPTV